MRTSSPDRQVAATRESIEFPRGAAILIRAGEPPGYHPRTNNARPASDSHFSKVPFATGREPKPSVSLDVGRGEERGAGRPAA